MSATETEHPSTGELVYRALDPGTLSVRDQGDGAAENPVLTGRMMPYDQWTEVNSSIEGHFLERFAPGSLAKTLSERGRSVRVLFEHGMDILGKQPIATFDAFDDREDGAWFEASLLRSVPDLILEGLRRGVYGASIRFKPVPGKWDRVRSPGPSEHNPDGIPEHTIREAFVREFSVVTFPQYEGATAMVRSITDDVTTAQLLRDPIRLAEIIERQTASPEPQHSESEPLEREPEQTQSRSTRPARDFLTKEEAVPRWLL